MKRLLQRRVQRDHFLLTLLELMPQTLLRNFLRTLLMDFFANFAQIIFLYVTEKHFIFCYPKA
jgi:hypothetical protein